MLLWTVLQKIMETFFKINENMQKKLFNIVC